VAEIAAAWPAHEHGVARLRANVGHVCTINPRMTAPQPLLTAGIDHDAREHFGFRLFGSLALGFRTRSGPKAVS
jgi:hypothetical protein